MFDQKPERFATFETNSTLRMTHCIGRLVFVLCLLGPLGYAQTPAKLKMALDAQAQALEEQVIAWRRHFHQYPELSNREFNTSAFIVEHLKKLGLDVQYPVAKTGIVALLRGVSRGPWWRCGRTWTRCPLPSATVCRSLPKRKPHTAIRRQA